MGAAKKRLVEMKQKYPFCCLCAGGNFTETIEHAPPKVMFWHKHRQKGMEVPACKRCNGGTSQDDQLAAFICLTQSPRGSNLSQEESAYIDKVMSGAWNNIPHIKDMLKIGEPVGNNHKIHFDNQLLFSERLNPWAAKQTFAHWFTLTDGKALTEKAVVAVRWMTNAELMTNHLFQNLVIKLEGTRSLKNGEWESDDQFKLKYSLNAKEELGAIFAKYHGAAFMAAVVGDKKSLGGYKGELLGGHSAAFMTSTKNGIYEVTL